jgi:phage shock protein A
MAVQRAMDKTENMKARADAVGELEQAGTFEDPMQLGSGGDDLDHKLAQLTSTSEVDSELEKMKAELNAGSAPPQLGSGGSGAGGSGNGTEVGS